MFIYRVQDSKGKGFYSSGAYSCVPPINYWYKIFNSCDWDMLDLLINKAHPRSNVEVDETYNYAFSSLKELQDWFPDDIIHYMKCDVVRIEIDKENVITDNKQCMYKKEHVINIVVLDKSTIINNSISYPKTSDYMWD